MRVIKLNRVQIYKLPLAARPSQFNGLATDDPYMVTDVQRELEDQDAKPVREPEPSAKQIEDGEVIQSSSASAVYNPGWLGFLRHVDNQEGWYEFGDAHVSVKEFSENFIEPISKFKAEEYPFRTTCFKMDRCLACIRSQLENRPTGV